MDSGCYGRVRLLFECFQYPGVLLERQPGFLEIMQVWLQPLPRPSSGWMCAVTGCFFCTRSTRAARSAGGGATLASDRDRCRNGLIRRFQGVYRVSDDRPGAEDRSPALSLEREFGPCRLGSEAPRVAPRPCDDRRTNVDAAALPVTGVSTFWNSRRPSEGSPRRGAIGVMKSGGRRSPGRPVAGGRGLTRAIRPPVPAGWVAAGR